VTISAQTPRATTSGGAFLVFCGGGAVHSALAERLPAAQAVIAADCGLELAQTLGYRADVVVGDLDSVSAAALDDAVAAGATVERHDPVKDRTDLELALRAAMVRGAERVVVVGGAGGRLDHVLANALTMAAPEWDAMALEAVMGAARLWVCHDEIEIAGTPGEYVSLLALGGPARGVSTSGLRWRLDGETLYPGSGRGVSNELVDRTATVTVSAGRVVALAPGGGPVGIEQMTETR